MKDDEMVPRKRRPFATSFEELQAAMPQLRGRLAKILDEIYGQGNSFESKNVPAVREILKQLVKTVVPESAILFEEYQKLRKNWRLLLLGELDPDDVLKGRRKKVRKGKTALADCEHYNAQDQQKLQMKRRATKAFDDVELIKFILREELNGLSILNAGELKLVDDIKNMLFADDLDDRTLEEIRALIVELRDKVVESGDIINQRLLKNAFFK